MAQKSASAKARAVAGSRVRYGENGCAKRIKTGGAQWSEEAEEAFFDALGASCNVSWSAAEVGFTTFTVYRQRRMRPEFATRWNAALAQGYARLEMALVEAAVDTVEGAEFDADRPIPRMTVDQAMNLLKLHGPQVRGERRGPGNHARRRTLDEVRASIVKKIEAIENAAGASAAGETNRGAGDGGTTDTAAA